MPDPIAPKTWVDLLCLLRDELSKLEPVFGEHVPQREFYTACIELLSATDSELDAACAQFARTGQWPTISDAARLMLWFRLDSAMGFCWSQNVAGWENPPLAAPVPEGSERARLLTFLLVRLWHTHGSSQTLKMLTNLQTKDDPGAQPGYLSGN